MKLCLLACVFTVTSFGCHTASTAPTQTLKGHFVSYSPHMLSIEVDAPGDLNHQLMLPMDANVRVVAGHKQIPLEKLQYNAPIKITRNLETRQVTRIELSN